MNKRKKSVKKIKAQEKQKYTMSVFSETSTSYCKESTIHGFKNIITDIEELRSSTTKPQKIIKSINLAAWIVVWILSVLFGLILMQLVYNRFSNTPTITTIETNNYRNWNVHFPAITVCDINKVYGPATDPIVAILEQTGLNKSHLTRFFSHLSKLVVPERLNDTFEHVLESLIKSNYTIERLMFEVMRPCRELIQDCSWLGLSVPCRDIFHVATSSEGFCCSFNYIPSLDPNKIFTKDDFIEDTVSEPKRAAGAGPSAGLEAVIAVSKKDYVSYSHTFYGVAIYVHSYNEFPQPSDRVVIAQPSTDVQIAIQPSVVVSSENIRGLPLDLRNCFFDDEKLLRTSLKYTYQSCISECTVNETFQRCKCIPFYFPEIHLMGFTDTFKQCTLADVNCLRDNREILNSLQPNDVNETLGMDCNSCRPSCSEEAFTVHTITSTLYDIDNLLSLDNPEFDLQRFVQLSVFYKDMACIKYRRDIFMTWDTLFASLGGILGLCLGGSVISLMEFLFYFSFKLLKNWFKHRSTRVQPINYGTALEWKVAVQYSRYHYLPRHANGINIGR